MNLEHLDRQDGPADDPRVERSVSLTADPTEVWRHLTDGSLLGEWMEGSIDIDPRPGGALTMAPVRGTRLWGTVEEVVDARRIQWSWRTDEGPPSLVEMELRPDGAGTELTVRETLLPWEVGGALPRRIGSVDLRASATAVA